MLSTNKTTNTAMNFNTKITIRINLIRQMICYHNRSSYCDSFENHNLQVSETKTEEYEIKNHGTDNWKKCRLLGSLLGINKDISKSLALCSINKLNHLS